MTLPIKQLMIVMAIMLLSQSAAGVMVADTTVKPGKNSILTPVIAGSLYFGGALVVLPEVWYNDRERTSFHFSNDNGGYLQMDKFGHAFGAYAISYIGYNWMLNSGMPKKKALIYGGSLGLILQTPIEIIDGMHEGLGFSWGDMAANAFGSGLLIGQELLFERQIVKYKFSYHETTYARQSNGYLGTSATSRFFSDYNGHTYWFSAPLELMLPNNGLPDWLNIAAGYSANGMFGEYENITCFNGKIIPQTERYRQFLLSLDVDWTKIETESGFLKTLLQGLTFIKLPFPTLEYNSKGRWKYYWMYF